MVIILRTMNPNFDHVRDQILIGQEVPTLKSRNIQESVKSFASISFWGNRGCGTGGGHGDRRRLQCTYCNRIGHTQDNCYSLYGFLDKIADIF